MSTKDAAVSSVAGYLGEVGGLILDVGRAKYIDVEQGDEDRNIPDYIDTKQDIAIDVAGASLTTQQMGLIAAGIVGLLLIVKRVL
jgi:hypothetical protein